MNKDLSLLQRYPFEKLTELKRDLLPPAELEHIALSIGEPRHPAPQVVLDSLINHLHLLSTYPSTRGSTALREAIAAWLSKRFGIPAGQLAPECNVLPVSGTREALFAIAQCLIDRSAANPLLLMPNPFYQIYEGAALLSGATPRYLDCLPETDFLPDLDAVSDREWKDCQMIYICNPGNPTGAVMSSAYLQQLIELAHRHDFVIASDECYSEIYFDEQRPPAGLLGVAAEMGLEDEDVESVRTAGRLHDIGKIGIREEVLVKQGPLTDSEYEHVKQHVVVGSQILAPLTHLHEVIHYVRSHHERWDGRGYPDGLKGEEIPIGARILAAVEVYDALTTSRPYQEKMSSEFAVERMRDLTGAGIATEVFDALEAVVSQRQTLVFLDDAAQNKTE